MEIVKTSRLYIRCGLQLEYADELGLDQELFRGAYKEQCGPKELFLNSFFNFLNWPILIVPWVGTEPIGGRQHLIDFKHGWLSDASSHI